MRQAIRVEAIVIALLALAKHDLPGSWLLAAVLAVAAALVNEGGPKREGLALCLSALAALLCLMGRLA